jgi:hypothetical protein
VAERPIDKDQRDTDTERDAAEEQEPSRTGDVLGLSDAPPEVEIPRATEDRSGHPAGIEVRTPASGTGDLRRGKGATGMEMGAGGSGTDVEPARRPSAVDPGQSVVDRDET